MALRDASSSTAAALAPAGKQKGLSRESSMALPKPARVAAMVWGERAGWEQEERRAGRAAHGKGARCVGGGTKTVLLKQQVMPQHKSCVLPSCNPVRSPCTSPGEIIPLGGDATRQECCQL